MTDDGTGDLKPGPTKSWWPLVISVTLWLVIAGATWRWC